MNDNASRAGTPVHPKVCAEHLEKKAIVYVRQSTDHQVHDHRESTERQYALRAKPLQLGWLSDDIETIDEDLGISGTIPGIRPGFQRMLSDITQGRVGIVFGIEMSRLARNSREWQELFEVCGIYRSLIADEDGIFDPNDTNDRLILGLKGLISEVELHTIKVRMERGRLHKAQKGELFTIAPVGFIRDERGLPIKDPDIHARAALESFFQKFDEIGSARGLFRYCVRHDFKLPFRDKSGQLDWRVPGQGTVQEILRNPLYAGAYAYGKRSSPRPNSTYRKRLPPDQWKVLLKDRFAAYISWEQYERNTERIRENNNWKDRSGPVRGGNALLGGILYCGHCCRKLAVTYSQSRKGNYHCPRTRIPGREICMGTVHANVLDALVVEQLLEALRPAGIELSLQVIEDEQMRRKQRGTQLHQAVERAAYEATLAERRYKVIDPDYRAVARKLEQEWNENLLKLQEAEQELAEFQSQKAETIPPEQRQQFIDLASDIPAIWHSPDTSNEDRKKILRCLIQRVDAKIIDHSEVVEVSIHWQGGCITHHQMERDLPRINDLSNYDELTALVVASYKQGATASKIAELCNVQGMRTSQMGTPFTRSTIIRMLSQPAIHALIEQPELGPDDWDIKDLAREFDIPVQRVKSWMQRGIIPAESVLQRPRRAPWIVRLDAAQFQRLQTLVLPNSVKQLDNYEEVLDFIVQLRKAGNSAEKIADTLNKEGYLLPNGKPFTRTRIDRITASAHVRERINQPELEADDWTLEHLAERLNARKRLIQDWISIGRIPEDKVVQRPTAGTWVVRLSPDEVERLDKFHNKSHPQDNPDLVELIVTLRREGKPNRAIALALNNAGYRTTEGLLFDRFHVNKLTQQSPVRERIQSPELEEHDWIVDDLADELNIPAKQIKQWVVTGRLSPEVVVQRPRFGPWVFRLPASQMERVYELAQNRRRSRC